MIKLLCITSVILIVLCTVSLAQVKEEWIAKYDGPAKDAGPRKIIIDKLGNLYVTASSKPDSTYMSDDIVTIKYNSAGSEQWVQRYGGKGFDSPSDIAADNSGNVYVTGNVSKGKQTDIATIKYSPTGEELWVRTYDGPGYSDDYSESIAIDAENNIYVGGSSVGAGTSMDIIVIKYNSSGEKLWIQRYNGPGNTNDYAGKMCVDNSGNIYVSGNADAYTGYDFKAVIIKYNNQGERQWLREFDKFNPQLMCLDKKGNIYLSGSYHFPSDTVAHKILTIKYNSSGVKEWGEVYGDDDKCEKDVNDITADSFGNVYLTAAIEVKVKKGLGSNMLTIKYGSNGDSLWVRKFGAQYNNNGEGSSIAVDRKGNVYVAGATTFGKNDRDFATVKYDPKGDTVWVKQYDDGRETGDWAISLVMDSSNNLYVTGTRTLEPYYTGHYGIVTIKYKQK